MAEVEKSGIPTEQKVSTSESLKKNNGLLLYSYHHCFYSQKVLMVLYEKKIPFTTKLVDITRGEQYQLWYLQINSRGEVPVLKDGIKYIPDSERIIQYLEDNFSNGEHSRLIPLDQGPEIRQKIIKYHTDFESIPVNVLTFGSIYNKELCSNFKYPFNLTYVHVLMKEVCKLDNKALKSSLSMFPNYSGSLREKLTEQEKRYHEITDKLSFITLLVNVTALMDKVENELASHDKDQSEWWLCTDRFTIADVSLTVLLDRLSRIGLQNHFWGEGKRPNIEKYFRKVQERDSYKKTMPTFMTDLSIILKNKAPLILVVITVVVGSFIYFKK